MTTAGGATRRTLVVLSKRETTIQALFHVEGPAGRTLGEGQGGNEEGKQKWREGDLLADEWCSPAVLDFLRSTYVGRAAPPVEENWDSGEEEEQRAVAAAGVMGEEEEPME